MKDSKAIGKENLVNLFTNSKLKSEISQEVRKDLDKILQTSCVYIISQNSFERRNAA